MVIKIISWWYALYTSVCTRARLGTIQDSMAYTTIPSASSSSSSRRYTPALVVDRKRTSDGSPRGASIPAATNRRRHHHSPSSSPALTIHPTKRRDIAHNIPSLLKESTCVRGQTRISPSMDARQQVIRDTTLPALIPWHCFAFSHAQPREPSCPPCCPPCFPRRSPNLRLHHRRPCFGGKR